jgi:5-methylcytosine-specific restriction endonuclease McrA
MIKHKCSDGSQVSQATIDRKRSEAYRDRYDGRPQVCQGCGRPAEGSAHIIPQARCKQLHKTELIWSYENFFPACHKCNAAIENPKGKEWKKLLNLFDCLSVIKKYDPELYAKFDYDDGLDLPF